jgi:hypothetical protein
MHPRKVAFAIPVGQGTPSENTVAYQAYLAKPDFLFIPGDIVYSSGRISEYRERFYPTYNADEPAATIGAPLLRSVSVYRCAGGEDGGHREAGLVCMLHSGISSLCFAPRWSAMQRPVGQSCEEMGPR